MDLDTPFVDPWHKTLKKISNLRRKYRKHFSYYTLDNLLGYIFSLTKDSAVIFRLSHYAHPEELSPYIIKTYLGNVPKHVRNQSIEEFFEKNVRVHISMRMKKEEKEILQEFAKKASWIMFFGHIERLSCAGLYCYEHLEIFSDILLKGMPVFDSHMQNLLRDRLR